MLDRIIVVCSINKRSEWVPLSDEWREVEAIEDARDDDAAATARARERYEWELLQMPKVREYWVIRDIWGHRENRLCLNHNRECILVGRLFLRG